MADNTTNNNFRYPQQGDTDYEQSFQTFFEQIDRAVEIRDVDGAKGTYTPKDNAKYFATDTEDIYIGDGSSWVPLDTAGPSPTFTNLTTDTVTVNTKITDAAGFEHTGELADAGDPQPPQTHDLAGSTHNSSTLSDFNSKISDATLLGDGTDIIGTTRLDESIAPTWTSKHIFNTLQVDTTLTDASGTSHGGELADASDVSNIQSSSDVDHDNTSNRTHSGDDITPDSVSTNDATVTNSLTDPSGVSHSGELADSSDLDSVSSTSTASGYEITINGDTYQFNE